LCLTEDKLYGFGNYCFGQLGNNLEKKKSSPEETIRGLMEIKTDLSIIDRVLCGMDHSFVVSNGKVYYFGSNSNGQLCTGDTVNRSSLHLINIPQIKKLSTFMDSAIAVTQSNQVLFWGNNEHSCIKGPAIISVNLILIFYEECGRNQI
jgi:alpha-tubulin suppressor-like RCC1 family protein